MTNNKLESFYDGDDAFYIRVEGTVFKVALGYRLAPSLMRFQLSDQRLRNSDLFSSMLSLPQPANDAREGRSFERPVVLNHSATTREFTNFAWAAHARPREISAFMREEDTTEKCEKLLDIAALAHRFQLNGDAEWAIDEAINILRQCWHLHSFTIASRLLHVAVLWGNSSPEFLYAEDMASAALFGCVDVDLVELVHVLECLGSRKLLGLAYYRLLIRGQDHWTDARLTRQDLRRLQNGYFAITQIILKVGLETITTCSSQAARCPNCAQQLLSYRHKQPNVLAQLCDQITSLSAPLIGDLPDILNFEFANDARTITCGSCLTVHTPAPIQVSFKGVLPVETLFDLFDTNTGLTARLFA